MWPKEPQILKYEFFFSTVLLCVFKCKERNDISALYCITLIHVCPTIEEGHTLRLCVNIIYFCPKCECPLKFWKIANSKSTSESLSDRFCHPRPLFLFLFLHSFVILWIVNYPQLFFSYNKVVGKSSQGKLTKISTTIS